MISPKNCLLDRHDPSQQFFVFSCDLSFAICGIDHEVLDDHGFDEQVLDWMSMALMMEIWMSYSLFLAQCPLQYHIFDILYS